MAGSKFEALIEGLAQGGSLGFADELGGAFQEGLRRAGVGEYPEEMGGYEEARDLNRQVAKRAQAEHPITYGAGQLAGGILATAPLGAAGGTLKAAMAEGALTGIGEGEGGLDVGAAARGAATGAAGYGLGRYVKKLAERRTPATQPDTPVEAAPPPDPLAELRALGVEKSDTWGRGRELWLKQKELEDRMTAEEFEAYNKAQDELLSADVPELMVAKKGEPFSYKGYRGFGRPPGEDSVTADSAPQLGAGRYSTPKKKIAEDFGPFVEQIDVKLNKPWVPENKAHFRALLNLATSRALMKRGARPDLLPTLSLAGERELDWTIRNEMQAILKDRGYDGIVIPKYDRVNFDSQGEVIEFNPPPQDPRIQALLDLLKSGGER